MALPRVYRVVQDSLGNVVPQVLCSVLNEGTGVLATLWQDDAATIPLSNPMTSDATYGSFGFYVEPGHYDLTFTKPGYTFQPQLDMQVPQDDLTLGTMAQQDAANVAITGGSARLDTLGVGAAPNPSGLVVVGGTSYFGEAIGVKRAPDPGGALSIGGTSYFDQAIGIKRAPDPNVSLSVTYDRAIGQGLMIIPSADTGVGTAVLFLNAALTGVGGISTSGSATAYNTTSDVRLKHAITALTGALDKVTALRPVRFRWNADDSQDEGFLAHELMQVLPRAVTGEPDAVDAQGNVLPQGVDHSKLVPWLTAALQETLAQVQALTARVVSLEQQLGI